MLRRYSSPASRFLPPLLHSWKKPTYEAAGAFSDFKSVLMHSNLFFSALFSSGATVFVFFLLFILMLENKASETLSVPLIVFQRSARRQTKSGG